MRGPRARLAFIPKIMPSRMIQDMSIGTVKNGGVIRLISDRATAKTRLSHRDTPPSETVPMRGQLTIATDDMLILPTCQPCDALNSENLDCYEGLVDGEPRAVIKVGNDRFKGCRQEGRGSNLGE